MSETSNPVSLARRNAYCAICDKFFCRPFALRRHNLTKHIAASLQIGNGLYGSGISRDLATSSNASNKNSDEEDSSTQQSDDTGSTDTGDNSSDSDDDGPQLNEHDRIVSETFINQYQVGETKAQKLRFVRGIFNFNHHFLKSNLYNIVNNAMDHFQTGFESMGRKEALRKAVNTRSGFILKFFKEEDEGEEEEEEDNKRVSEEDDR